LTIKFTRHTAASLPAFSCQLSAVSFQPSANLAPCHPERSIVSRSETMRSRGTLCLVRDFQQNHHTPIQLYGPVCLLLARNHCFASQISCPG
jgi:hypothetical protein